MKKFLLYLGLGAMVTLSACYPQGPQYVEDMDVVMSNYDNQFSFGSKTTFWLPDKVANVTGEPNSGNIGYLNASYSKTILDRIRQNMTSRGYTVTNDTNAADLRIYPAVLSVDFTTYFDYWYGYWGYGDGYGWYYPPYYSSYTFTVGTLMMNMIDSKNANPDGSHDMVWFGAINGLTGTSYATTMASRINNGIDRAFTQSPYIKKTK